MCQKFYVVEEHSQGVGDSTVWKVLGGGCSSGKCVKGSACGGILESVWRALFGGWFLAGNIISEYGKVLGGIQDVEDSSRNENIQGMCGKLFVGWGVNIVSEYVDGWGRIYGVYGRSWGTVSGSM